MCQVYGPDAPPRNQNKPKFTFFIIFFTPKTTKRDVVLPPSWRPFGDRLCPGPRHIKTFLNMYHYKTEHCFSGKWNHVLETTKQERLTRPCSTFVGKVPFVKHKRGAGGKNCVEELTLGSELIQTFVRPAEGNSDC